MKGVVFIGWSGSNDLAILIKKKIEENDYKCIVGGNHEITNDQVFVGGTILTQLQQSNQAIFLIQKKASGGISNNLMFELGYALSKFNQTTKKIHLYYIDMEENDDTIPSDLRGAWATYLYRDGSTTDELVSVVVNEFLKKQKVDISENKMDVVDSWYKISQELDVHFTNPLYSDYELAQYILFYTQAAYMFDGVKNATTKLRKLIRDVDPTSIELYNSVQLSLVSLDLFSKPCSKGNTLYLDDMDFLDIYNRYIEVFASIEQYDDSDNPETEYDESTELKKWSLAIGKEHLNYAYMMYAANPELDEDEIADINSESIKCGEEVISYCNELILRNETANKEFAALLKSYVYRNLAHIYGNMDGAEEKRNEYLLLSLTERKKLVDYYSNLDIDTRLLSNFEMEYYLALCESTAIISDARTKRINLKILDKYIKKETKKVQSNSFYLDHIINAMNQMKGDDK